MNRGRQRLLVAGLVLVAFLTGACAKPRPIEPSASAVNAAGETDAAAEHTYRDEPWVYDGRAGRSITTPHYRIFLTQTEPAFVGRVPAFLEAAMRHYRAVAAEGAETAPTPAPAHPLTTYVFRTRPEWERMTRQLLGESAGPFLRIRRGGYAWGGVAVLFDLDGGGGASRDTLSLIAHEGWHQFTQATFGQPLPPWLEEGLATLCEGYTWTGGPSVVSFEPMHNPERRRRLAGVLDGGRFRGIQSIVLNAPADLAAGDSGGALDYYAQVFALAAYLSNGDGGRHADSLSECLEDARTGRLGDTIVRVLGPERAGALLNSTGQGRSLAVLEAYFGSGPGGLDALEAGYRRYCAELAAGGREQ